MQVRDPVCGMQFTEEQGMARSVYHGRMFHFCSPHCKGLFEDDPARYVEDEPTGWQARCAGPHWQRGP